MGWATEHKVSLKNPCPDMILNEPEKMWIVTCFMAMSNASFVEVVDNYNEAARRLEAAVREQRRRRREKPSSPEAL